MTDTNLTLELSGSIIPSVDELREITAKAIKDKKTDEHGKLDLPDKVLEHFITSMEKDILDFASKGHYYVEWNYGALDKPPTRHQMSQISAEFKKRHSRIMIICSPTKISASWKLKR